MDILGDWMTPWLDLIGGCGAHAELNFCGSRWWLLNEYLAEIIFVIAENFGIMGEFLDTLSAREYGEASRKKLRAIYDDPVKRHELRQVRARRHA
eukprot:2475642-Pleurochrysis_carterae.AAC.1